MQHKYYKTCRVRCKFCGDVLEHENKTKQDDCNDALSCSCKKTVLDPSASFYRIVENPDDYEDLSEEWDKEHADGTLDK